MIWKKIQEYDYSINELGQVKNDLTGRILKNILGSHGYYCVVLCKDGKKKHFSIHRLLCKCFKENEYSEELFVDHIDRNRLNNNLNNLRMVNHRENICNQTKKKNRSSIFKGVYFNTTKNKWQVAITFNYKQIYIGRYETELEAAKAYNDYIDQNNLQYYSKNIF